MPSPEAFLATHLSEFRLAGCLIRVQFRFAAAPALPPAAVLLHRQRFSPSGLEYLCWSCARRGHYRVFWSDAGTFDVDARRGRVCCYVKRGKSPTAVEEAMRGSVCSICMVERRFEPLHAGSVVFAGSCAVFLGPARSGKSSLIAYLTQRGAKFLSDDMVPLRLLGRVVHAFPGLAQIRLTPRAIRALRWTGPLAWATRWKATLRMRAPRGRASFPVTRIYVLDRRDNFEVSRPRLELLPPRHAFVALVGNSLNRAIQAPRRLERQLRVLGALADRVPARRLIYPNGFRRLSRVRQLILEDLGVSALG